MFMLSKITIIRKSALRKVRKQEWHCERASCRIPDVEQLKNDLYILVLFLDMQWHKLNLVHRVLA